VVLTKDRLQADLKLPLEAFDLDPQVEKGAVPAGGALLIPDVPGFMRSELENSVSIGPGRITTTPTALPRDQIPPERATEEDPILDRIHGDWLGKIVGGVVPSLLVDSVP